MQANLFALIDCEFRNHAQRLRSKYPSEEICNADVFESAIKAFSQFGYIELVDSRRRVPDWVPSFLRSRLSRVRHFPIWIPGRKFPDSAFDMDRLMQADISDGKVVWHHTPAKKSPTWWRED